MTRHIILGNGNILVCLDKHARIRDFYYPYVGQENHVSSNMHRIGVWIDGVFSWVSADDWKMDLSYRKDALVSEVVALHERLQVRLTITEAVHYEKNIFLRHVQVENMSLQEREVRVFFSQHFHISEANIGDTVYYNPLLQSIVNYKGKRYFLISGQAEGKSFTDYATGVAGVDGKDGTFKDAEDGVLGKNAIEHGSVDSTIGFSLRIKEGTSKHIDYWIAVGQKYHEICQLRDIILSHTADKLIRDTEHYWITWANKTDVNFYHLDQTIQNLFRRSLLVVRAQTDNHGAIIAANDTHTFHYKKDTYSYMWPRDGALIARSLDKVGHHDMTNKFFIFCSNISSEDGYLLHKYRPDGSLGSSWHSWLKGNKVQLPIQEDETALVLDALWKHYDKYKDYDMINKMYSTFIKRAADFMVTYRDPATNLPKESYDLWEEKLGVHTFTCSTVYAGLIAAASFAEIFGSKSDAKRYRKVAAETKEAIIKYLYDEEDETFIKGVFYNEQGDMLKDKTIDSSTGYGLFEYRVLDVDDPTLVRTMDKAFNRLCAHQATCGGLARYENDHYYRVPGAPENPWFISTMWFAEYMIAKAKNLEELRTAETPLHWAVSKALSTGVLSEQINPLTGEPLSVAPLTWSHAGFIIAVIKYLDKFEQLSGIKD